MSWKLLVLASQTIRETEHLEISKQRNESESPATRRTIHSERRVELLETIFCQDHGVRSVAVLVPWI